MRSVHRIARVGFDAGAEAYERGRPGYPRDAVDAIVGELRIARGTPVLELAAGTGKFTRLLVPTGARIVAVEPVEGMRRAFAERVPGVPVLAGTAEAIPLAASTVDAAVVAQAFHWFDGPAALEELHRVLRPAGRLGLVWNARDEESELGAAMTVLFDRYRGGAPAFRGSPWRLAFEETELFTSLRSGTFPYEQVLSREQLHDRALSVSFMASLPESEQREVRRHLDELIPATATEVVLSYRTEVYWCERVSPR